MPRFAANLTMLWPELSNPFDRFKAAADAGFTRVEMLFPGELDHDLLAAALKDNGLEMVLFDPAGGNWGAGERGLLCHPGREGEFLGTVRDAVKLAKRIGTPRLNCLAGLLPAGVSREEAFATAVSNLTAATRVAADEGLVLLIENINTTDMPGYFAETPDLAVELIKAVGAPNLRFQLDQYHAGMMGVDALTAFRQYRDLVEHVQVADVPGRHEPGTGDQPIQEFLHALDADGYVGVVGLEYRPAGATDSGLEWLPRSQRG